MRVLRYRNHGYLFAAVALFFAARWVFLQGKTERLRDLPNRGDFLFDIRQDTAYFQMNDPLPTLVAPLKTLSGQTIQAQYSLPPPLVLRALPVTGGSGQFLGEDRREGLAFQQIQVIGDSLYYLAYPQEPIPILTASFGSSALTRNRMQPPPVAPATLHRVSLNGGAPIKIAAFPALNLATTLAQGRPVGILGERLYWIEIERSKRSSRQSGSLKVAFLNGSSRQESSLVDSSPETLLTSLSPNTSLRVTEEPQPTLWIFLPAENSFTKKHIYCLSALDREPRLFMKNAESGSGVYQSVYWNGRLYWKQDVYSLSPEVHSLHQTDIISAAPDGSDIRVVHSVQEPESLLSLHAHAGSLYAQIEKEDKRVLMRVEPDSPAPLREVFRFPHRAQQPYFDGDYLYYAVNEEREDLWNWSGRRRRPVRTTVLYRCRLPR